MTLSVGGCYARFPNQPCSWIAYVFTSSSRVDPLFGLVVYRLREPTCFPETSGAVPCGAPGPQQAQTNIAQLGTYSIYSKNQITDQWKSFLQASLSNNNGQVS